jgi:Phytanoyl-CoA dioxygenase (PhyH)
LEDLSHMSPSQAAAFKVETGLPPIPGLAELWERATGRTQTRPPHDMAARVVLDTLGLGLEQTFTYLRERPEFDEFKAWILDTVGQPDPMTVARYRAWLDREPVPESAHRRLRAIEEAGPVFDAADLAHWEAEGYVILRHAITSDQAKAAEALLWRRLEASADDPESWYAPRTNGIMIQLFQDPALEAARRSPRVHKAFAQLWGTADLWMTIDRMSFNPPERPGRKFPGPDLHWDVSLMLPMSFATQGILYLTDTSADQGALQVVPGFHHRLATWLESIGDADPRRIDLKAEARTIAAGAGDLIIWRQELPHGASPNTTERPRMAQYVNMYSADLESHPVWR